MTTKRDTLEIEDYEMAMLFIAIGGHNQRQLETLLKAEYENTHLPEDVRALLDQAIKKSNRADVFGQLYKKMRRMFDFE